MRPDSPSRLATRVRALSPPLLVLLSWTLAARASAQTAPANDSPTAVWIDVGGGYAPTMRGFAGLLSAAAARGQHVLSLRVLGTREAGDNLAALPRQQAADAALLYGVGTFTGRGFMVVGGGLGVSHGSRRGTLIALGKNRDPDTYHQVDYSVPSVALSVELGWTPWRHVGVGLTIAGALNREQPMAMAIVGVEIGRFGQPPRPAGPR